jgi:hypothetical protein
MSDQPQQPVIRGATLLAAHCNSLDPSAATARERLDAEIGPELARVLVFALASEGHSRAELVCS